MPSAPSTPLTARAEPRFLAWAAAALPRAFPGLPALTATTLRAAWTLAAREIAARLALALAREDLVAVDHDALRGRAGPISVPLRRRGAFGLHQPDLDAPRTAPLEHPHALLTALDLGLAPATRARLELELADSVFHLAMARVIAELRVRARLARAPWPAPLDPENLVISGHPWHPMCKTRLGLHLHEVLRFAPEALAAARVHAVDVDPALVHTSGAFAAMSAELFPPAAPGWLRPARPRAAAAPPAPPARPPVGQRDPPHRARPAPGPGPAQPAHRRRRRPAPQARRRPPDHQRPPSGLTDEQPQRPAARRPDREHRRRRPAGPPPPPPAARARRRWPRPGGPRRARPARRPARGHLPSRPPPARPRARRRAPPLQRRAHRLGLRRPRRALARRPRRAPRRAHTCPNRPVPTIILTCPERPVLQDIPSRPHPRVRPPPPP
ncbi:MAG: hypothetical protein IPJ59_08805 [Nannocystis sp.]|nr:IucA/IucC family protein [Nannocystis sp.]MBK7825297.1 hypothetical protein [Nannocystis sp.]